MKMYKHKSNGSTMTYKDGCMRVDNLVIEGEPNLDFWEEVEEEKDYEILSYINIRTKEILKRVGNYCFKDSHFVLHQTTLDSSGLYKIHSVRRVSDNEIFSIGDKVRIKKLKHDGSFIIDEFYFDCNNDKLLCNGKCTGNGHVSINKIEKTKGIMFTSEDGVEIFESDDYYKVSSNFSLRYEVAKLTFIGEVSNCKSKYFKSYEKAKEYILMNKPCLSIKDIEDISSPFYAAHSNLTHKYNIKYLVELVKSKL